MSLIKKMLRSILSIANPNWRKSSLSLCGFYITKVPSTITTLLNVVLLLCGPWEYNHTISEARFEGRFILCPSREEERHFFGPNYVVRRSLWPAKTY